MTKPKSTQPKVDPAQEVTAALADHPGATAPEIADAAGIGHSTAQRHLTALESVGIARREEGGWRDGKKFRDRWFLVTATHSSGGHSGADQSAATHPGAAESPGVASDGSSDHARSADEATPSPSEHLAKGELAALVLAHLATHREDLGPSAVAKALERSSGAVANALERLVTSGDVRLVGEKPRRYRLARGQKD